MYNYFFNYLLGVNMSFLYKIFGITERPAAVPAAQPKAPSQGSIQGRNVTPEAAMQPAAAKAAAVTIPSLEPRDAPLQATSPLSVNLSPKQRFELKFQEFLKGRFNDPIRFVGFAEILEKSRESSKVENISDFNSQIYRIFTRNAPLTYQSEEPIAGNARVAECQAQCRTYWEFISDIEKNPALFEAGSYDTQQLMWMLLVDGLKDQKEVIAKELIKRHQNPLPDRSPLYIANSILAKMMEHGKPSKEEAKKLIHYILPLSVVSIHPSSIDVQKAFLGVNSHFNLAEFSREFSEAFKINGPFISHLDNESRFGIDSYGLNTDYHALKLALLIYKDAELVQAFSEGKAEWIKYHGTFAKEVSQYIQNYQSADQFVEVLSNSNLDKGVVEKVIAANARNNMTALMGFRNLINLSSFDSGALMSIRNVFRDKKDLLLKSIDLGTLVKLHDFFDEKAVKERLVYLVKHTLDNEIVDLLASIDGTRFYHTLAKDTDVQSYLKTLCKRYKDTQYLLPTWERTD